MYYVCVCSRYMPSWCVCSPGGVYFRDVPSRCVLQTCIFLLCVLKGHFLSALYVFHVFHVHILQACVHWVRVSRVCVTREYIFRFTCVPTYLCTMCLCMSQ